MGRMCLSRTEASWPGLIRIDSLYHTASVALLVGHGDAAGTASRGDDGPTASARAAATLVRGHPVCRGAQRPLPRATRPRLRLDRVRVDAAALRSRRGRLRAHRQLEL